MATNLDSSTVAANQTITATERNNLRKDLLRNAGDYEVTAGAANTYTLAIDAQIAALTTGDRVRFRINATNTGASTLNVNGLGAKNIYKNSGASVQAGDLLNGQMYEATYSVDAFQLQSPTSKVLDENDFTAKGDLLSASAAGTKVALAVGANNTVPVADSGEASGLKYAAIPGLMGSGLGTYSMFLPFGCITTGSVTGVKGGWITNAYANFSGYTNCMTFHTDALWIGLNPISGSNSNLGLTDFSKIAVESIIKFTSIPDTSSTNMHAFGFTDYTGVVDTNNQNDKAIFLVDYVGNLKTRTCAETAAGTEDTTITGYTPSDWNKYKIVFDNDAGEVLFYINDVLVATHDTSIPDTASQFFIHYQSGKASRALSVMPPVFTYYV